MTFDMSLVQRGARLRRSPFFDATQGKYIVITAQDGGIINDPVLLRLGQNHFWLWERIMDTGRPHQIRPTGPSDIRRIEAGILNWGADMTLENNVYEVGLERLVDEDKSADYIGKEALKWIRRKGATRKSVGVEIAGDPLPFNESHVKINSRRGQRHGTRD